MKLPNATDVRIDERKVRDYLLSPSHPIGRSHALVFAALGFDQRSAAAFISEIRRIAASSEIAGSEKTSFGDKFLVPGELTGPAGSRAVVTLWLREYGHKRVRLVTVRPR